MSLWRGIGFVIVLSSNICLFVAATPAFSSYLTHQLEAKIPTGPDLRNAQAVVVLGADFQSAERAAMSDRLGPLSLERLVFASDAYHQLHLPVAVSGGRVGNMQSSLAELMKTTLETYLKIPVTWIEDQSLTTYENALYTERLLRDQHVHTIVLIAQTRDLPRAIWSFERVGLHPLPWPAPRTPLELNTIEDFLPDTTSLQASFYALHELLGSFYYRVRY